LKISGLRCLGLLRFARTRARHIGWLFEVMRWWGRDRSRTEMGFVAWFEYPETGPRGPYPHQDGRVDELLRPPDVIRKV